MEAAALRVRIRKAADSNFTRRSGRRLFPRIGFKLSPSRQSSPSGRPKKHPQHPLSRRERRTRSASEGALRSWDARNLIVSWKQTAARLIFAISFSFSPALRADIPWPEVVQRLALENGKLARRPQG